MGPAEETVRLLLALPDAVDGLAVELTSLLAAVHPAGVLMAPGMSEVSAIRRTCRDGNAAFLVVGDLEEAHRLGADGVLLDREGDVRRARARLGQDAIIGASCGVSRHAAMVAGELGADYVVFAGDPDGAAEDPHTVIDLVRWWAELFVLPCAVDARRGVVDLPTLVSAGMDLLVVGGEVWRHADGPLSALSRLAADLGQAHTLLQER